MQIALIMLAIVAALRSARQPQPQTSFVPADEPILEALMGE